MIDSHVHLWRLGENGCSWPTADLAPIHRDFTLGDLRAVAEPAGVDSVILVQSQEEAADTQWLLSLGADPLVAGVVGWIDFGSPNEAEAARDLAANSALRGLRPMAQDRDNDWYDSPAIDQSFEAMAQSGLVLDALVRPRHLPSLRRLANRHPNLSIVINHGAKPNFANIDDWAEQIRAIALCRNAACKLSGLLTELAPGAPREAIRPAFDVLWNAFGPERLIWGSDWPVLTLASSYEGWLEQALGLVPASHHESVFDSNARRLYGIAP